MHKFPILLIDDQPLITDVVEQAAKISFPEACFTQVNNLDGAKEYLANLAGRGPRLALINIDSSDDLDGLALLRFLHDHPQGLLLPVIVLSMSDTNLLVTQAYQAGASAFVQKPVDYEGWKTYLEVTRRYWYETATLPPATYRQMAMS